VSNEISKGKFEIQSLVMTLDAGDTVSRGAKVIYKKFFRHHDFSVLFSPYQRTFGLSIRTVPKTTGMGRPASAVGD